MQEAGQQSSEIAGALGIMRSFQKGITRFNKVSQEQKVTRGSTSCPAIKTTATSVNNLAASRQRTRVFKPVLMIRWAVGV